MSIVIVKIITFHPALNQMAGNGEFLNHHTTIAPSLDSFKVSCRLGDFLPFEPEPIGVNPLYFDSNVF